MDSIHRISLRGGLVVLALFLATGAAGSEPQPPLHTYVLMPGLSVRVDAGGDLVWVSAGAELARLHAASPLRIDPRRRHASATAAPFQAVTAEGAPGGCRGLSSRADDDGDGLIDEDPLDGLDNDADGRVDEDFAAVSDAMVTVRREVDAAAGRAIHLDYYHWAYPHLRSAVFLALGGSADSEGSTTLDLTAPRGAWFEMDVSTRQHRTGDRELVETGAYVAQIEAPAVTGATPRKLWLGLVLLESPRNLRARVAGDRMELIATGSGASLAICAAESWLQVCRLLNDAVAVRAGVTDPVSGHEVPWAVPAPCVTCRRAADPTFTCYQAANGDLVIGAEFSQGCEGLPDPDLLHLGRIALGAPGTISWITETGDASRAWVAMSPDLLDRPHEHLCDPYGPFADLAGHAASGRLEWRFPNVGFGVDADIVRGKYMDGRSFETAIRTIPAPQTQAELPLEAAGLMGAALPLETVDDPGARLTDDANQPLALSPELLQGWPNPFHDSIQIRFEVPGTAGAAFGPEMLDKQYPNLSLDAPVPWRTGQPFVTVKIYSLNGQELISLQGDFLGVGSYNVQWNGTDNLGRRVASGNYFCKLQMDTWSVTRRFSFVR